MAETFISYKRENLAQVQPLVQALRANGVEVWWDQDIAPDAPWEATIERELETARVVIVCWSQAAVASENVKAEARRARNQGKLIQTFVEACDPPLFFGERQGVDLANWAGAPADRRFQGVLSATQALLAGKRPAAGVGYAPRKRTPWRTIAAAFAVLSAALAFVANLGGARDAVCGLAAAAPYCLRIGLVAAVTPSADPAELRAALLRSVEGAWGRQDRNCSETVRYRVSHGADGTDRITASATNFESVGQVIAAENGVVISRVTTPSANGGREQWEFRPDGDGMIVIDKDGVSTTLVRCPE